MDGRLFASSPGGGGRLAAALLPTLLAISLSCSSTPPGPANDASPGRAGEAPPPAANLGGTSWQLVEIQSMDDRVYTPEEPDSYTLAFADDGGVAIRADCNRGHATWEQQEGGGLSFGPMATTRAECPPGSLYSRFLSDLGHVRSFVLKDGHLHLATEADGAILEFEPMP